jgi:hypothetical protein
MADGVKIDTGQVGDFGRGMRTQADTGFASAASRATDLHSHGVVFGAQLPGGAILAAKTRYAQALEMTDANLRAYREAAVIFAEVAEQIARDFSAVDLNSAAAQQKVDGLLRNAIVRANKALGVTTTDVAGGGWA